MVWDARGKGQIPIFVVKFELSCRPAVDPLQHLNSNSLPPALPWCSGEWLGPQTVSEMRLPASYVDPRGDKADYMVYVYTSDFK